MYELGIHLTMTVALAFWLMEMPALALTGEAYFWGGQRWFELIFSHTLPQLVLFTEWTQSAI